MDKEMEKGLDHNEIKETHEDKGIRHTMKAFYVALARNRAKNMIIAVLLLTTLFGAYQYSRAENLRRQLNNAYNRAFYELVNYVQNVEVMLLKARMTSSPQLSASTLRDVWMEASAAANNLGQLPLSVGVLSNTEKFLAQVADFSQTLSKQNTLGKPIDEEQMKLLGELHSFSVSLKESLNDLKNDLSNGNFQWENVRHEGNEDVGKVSENMPVSFSSIDKNFQEMPTLIYDGPFSEHMQKRKALGLSGQKVDENKAADSIGKFLGKDNIRNVQKVSDNKNGVIDTYNFKIELDGKTKDSVAEADVSVIGGHVVWYLYNRDVGKHTIGIKEAKEIGRKFLEKQGYTNMKDSYYLESDGVATINYAYHEDGITYYPDLIKVKVALDNGEVVGFEAKGYLMSHTTRNFDTPKITEAEARQKVTRGESIKPSGLAVIPTDYGTELLCYEFIGKMDDKDFLVYINAITGSEEEVLLIINSDEGVLTM
jgi:germination protein YpeB